MIQTPSVIVVLLLQWPVLSLKKTVILVITMIGDNDDDSDDDDKAVIIVAEIVSAPAPVVAVKAAVLHIDRDSAFDVGSCVDVGCDDVTGVKCCC